MSTQIVNNEPSRIGLNDLSMILLQRADNVVCDCENILNTAFNIMETEDTYEAFALFYENMLDYNNINMEIYNKIIYYYEKAIEMNPVCIRILFNYSDFWRMVGNLEKRLGYLEAAALQNDKECIVILVKHYYETNDINKFLYFFLMTDYTDKTWCDNVFVWVNGNERNKSENIFRNFVLLKTLEVYDLLNNNQDIKLPNMNATEMKTHIETHRKKIRNSSCVSTFIMKKELFTRLNNIHDCVICYENKLNICLDCGHEVCLDCYKRTYNTSCHFCRF